MKITTACNEKAKPQAMICAFGNIFATDQTRPGGVVGYQYTRYFAPKIPIYLKIVKCVILNT